MQEIFKRASLKTFIFLPMGILRLRNVQVAHILSSLLRSLYFEVCHYILRSSNTEIGDKFQFFILCQCNLSFLSISLSCSLSDFLLILSVYLQPSSFCHIDILSHLLFILKYIWFTIFQAYSKEIQLYMHIFLFQILFHYRKIYLLNIFPCTIQ